MSKLPAELPFPADACEAVARQLLEAIGLFLFACASNA